MAVNYHGISFITLAPGFVPAFTVVICSAIPVSTLVIYYFTPRRMSAVEQKVSAFVPGKHQQSNLILAKASRSLPLEWSTKKGCTL
jgi:hypothetical protein